MVVRSKPHNWAGFRDFRVGSRIRGSGEETSTGSPGRAGHLRLWSAVKQREVGGGGGWRGRCWKGTRSRTKGAVGRSFHLAISTAVWEPSNLEEESEQWCS